MNSLMRLLRSEKVPTLKGLTVLPLSLNPEKDPALLNLTEGRLEVFNHEVNYRRLMAGMCGFHMLIIVWLLSVSGCSRLFKNEA